MIDLSTLAIHAKDIWLKPDIIALNAMTLTYVLLVINAMDITIIWISWDSVISLEELPERTELLPVC
jgi:hypothetical protein